LWRAGYVRIPDAGVEPGAGPPREAFAEGFEGDGASGEIVPIEWASLRYGVAPELLRGRRVQTITVRGDSMRPTIRPGERARIFILDGEPVQDGAVYVIGTPDGTVIKRIRFTSIETEDGRDVKRYVSIISDNKRAESFRVPHAVFERDYRCIAVLLEVLRPI
jgi:phage repressor protein C with HTH and peptisase S24 domain